MSLDAARTKSSNIVRIRFVFSCLGVVLTSFLSVIYAIDITVPCSNSGCNELLTGPSSTIYGVPISLLGLFAFLVIAFSCLRTTHQRVLLAGAGLSFLSVMVSIGLVGYASLKLSTTCDYCMGSTVIFSCIAATHALELSGREQIEPQRAGVSQGWFATATSLCILLGAAIAPFSTWLAPVPIIPTPSTLILETSPRFGSAEPTYSIVLFIDFQCGPCHEAIELAERTVDERDDVEVVIRHNPLPIHALAQDLAVFFQASLREISTRDALNTAMRLEPSSFADIDAYSVDQGIRPDDEDLAAVLTDKALAEELELAWTPAVFIVRGSRVEYIPDFSDVSIEASLERMKDD